MKQKRIQPQFSAKMAGTTLEILIYSEIGQSWWDDYAVGAIDVAAAIKEAGEFDTVMLRINSPGGSAFDGVTIYNLIRSLGKPVTVFIDGMAASAASVIAMAGDTIHVGQGAMLMIHNAAWGIFGDANALRKAADDIEKISVTIAQIYVSRTGQSAEDIAAMMDAETWLNGPEAVEKGFATDVVNDEAEAATAKALAAQFNLKSFRNVPAALKTAKAAVNPDCECECAGCQIVGCSACEMDPCDSPGCTCPNHEEMSADDVPLEMLRHRLQARRHAA